MTKYVLLLVSLLLMSSCTENINLLKGLQLGASENEWKRQVENLVMSKVFEKDEYGNNVTYLKIGQDSIKVEYHINKPYPRSAYRVYSHDSLYQNNPLRIIEINLEGDTICRLGGNMTVDGKEVYSSRLLHKDISENYSPRRKSIVNRIRHQLIKEYGDPVQDNLIDTYEYDNFLLNNSITELSLSKDKIISKEIFKLNDLWKKDNMIISLNRHFEYFDPCMQDSFYLSANITIKSTNFDNEINRIANNLVSNLKPNDLVSIEFKSPVFTQLSRSRRKYKLRQNIAYIHRESPEDKRLISDIKFDIVYLNQFHEEITRVKNCIYTFNNGLAPGISMWDYDATYEVEYHANTTIGASFEYLRNNSDRLKSNSKENIYIDVKKVAFTDGSVLD